MPKSYQLKGGTNHLLNHSRTKHQTILKRFNLQPSEIWHALAECRNIVFQIKCHLATVPSVIFILFFFLFSICCSEVRMLLNLQMYVLCVIWIVRIWLPPFMDELELRVDVFSLVNLTVTMTMSFACFCTVGWWWWVLVMRGGDRKCQSFYLTEKRNKGWIKWFLM